MFRRKLTEVAVDSFTDYLEERLEKLKELDLDKDGKKDVDQVIATLNRCGTALKEALDSTDFNKLATGLDHLVSGANLIGQSFDSHKMQAFGKELKDGVSKLGELAQLGITEMKERRHDSR